MSDETERLCDRRHRVLRLVATLASFVMLVPCLVRRATAQTDKPALVLDFDQAALGDQWSVQQKIAARRVAVPANAAANGRGPAGHCVEIRAGAQSYLFTKPGVVARDWRSFEEVSFWVYRSEQEQQRAQSSTIEVQLFEPDRQTRFWRRVDLSHGGWQQIRLPLRWLRWGGGRVPRFDAIDRLAFYFRDETNIAIDTIVVQPGRRDRPTELTDGDLSPIAFPGADPAAARFARSDHCLALTNAPGLNLVELQNHLSAVSDAVFEELPFLKRPATLPWLVVFATADEYRAFHPRLGEQLGAVAEPPASEGYTVHGVATSSWDLKQGSLRPVYTHEFVHALVARIALLPDGAGDWLQEGLAAHFQLRFHPQQNLAKIVERGLREKDQHTPLRDLLNGKRIATDRYWQAATVLEMLMHDEKYRDRLPALFEAFRNARSTDIGPQLEPVLQSNWDELDEQWKEYCKKTYQFGQQGPPSGNRRNNLWPGRVRSAATFTQPTRVKS